MLLGCNPQLVVVSIVPNLGHIFPVDNFPMRDGLLEVEDSLLGLGLITYICFLLIHTNHNGGHFGFSNNGSEFGPRGILS